jgi:hypothetical protein
MAGALATATILATTMVEVEDDVEEASELVTVWVKD